MKWHLLRNRLVLGLMMLLLVGCASDRRVDYNTYPELREARDDFNETYLRLVESQSPFYENDEQFHAALREQVDALYAIRELVKDTITSQYEHLTHASYLEVFRDLFEEMGQRNNAFKAGELEGEPEGPIVNFVQMRQDFHEELQRRNKRVEEMKIRKQAMLDSLVASDSLKGLTPDSVQ